MVKEAATTKNSVVLKSFVCMIPDNKETEYRKTKENIENEDFTNNTAFPARYTFALLALMALFNACAMRVNLSVAIVAMVRTTPPEDEIVSACLELLPPAENNQSTSNHSIEQQGEYDWDTQMQGLILSSFFYGYTVSNVPGGVIAEKYGAKWSVGMGVLCTSILTLLIPTAAGWGVGALVVLRILSGIVSGAIFPGLNVLMSRWIPKMERSRTAAFIYNGISFGTVVSSIVSGVLCESNFLGGWPSVFYVFGIVGCVWFVFWTFLVYDSPDVHPRISKLELEFIHNGLDNAESNKGPIPWRFILTSAPVWTIIITQFGISWIVFTFLTELPTYLHNVLHFKLEENGLLSALPYLLQMAFAFVASLIADKMRASGIIGITTIRKIMNSFGCYVPGLLMLAVIFVGCDPIAIVVLLSLSMGFNGFEYCGNFVTNVDMSPEFAGTLMGLSNTACSVAGLLTPLFTGWVIKNGQTQWNWGIVFITASAINLFVGTIYNIFASAELQPWGSTEHPSATQSDHRISLTSKEKTADNIDCTRT